MNLIAAVDWQPLIDAVKTLLMTANTALLLWVLSKQRATHRAVNGEGIGGKLDALMTGLAQTQKWQADHEKLDVERFESLAKQIAGLKPKPE